MAEKIEEGYEQGIRDMVKLERERGLATARQLAKYQGVTSLTKDQAMEILNTLWHDAPDTDKLAAAMLCSNYGLNPLANHIFLIKFHNKRLNRDDWARVWGIRAKRLLASRKGAFSYLDMSPRIMTDGEQIKVWGAVDKTNLCYLTHLKDNITGAEVYGYGKWVKDEAVYGADKGNSQANMASIRSESQALDRLRPAEMPSGFIATDEDYVDAEVRIVADHEETTKKMAEAPTFTPDKTTPETLEEKIPLIDLGWLRESLSELQWADVGKYLKGKYNVTGKSISAMVGQLSPEQSKEFTEEIQRRLVPPKDIDPDNIPY